jgi:spore coat protein U-like protein
MIKGKQLILPLKCLALWMLVCGIGSADAGTGTASLTVQITITSACTINAATLTFPTTAGTSLVSTAVTGNTTISATCTNGSPYSIGFDNGANYLITRRMATGGNYLGYGLYVDAALTRPWSTALTNSTCTVLNDCYLGTGTGSAQSISVYGQVPTVVSAPASGTYSDTVTMTITY